MIGFLFSSSNLPFTIALGLMFGIGLLEGVTTLFGAGASSIIESVLPDLGLDGDLDVDLDGEPGAPDGGDINTSGTLSRLVGWINVGRVPVLVMLVLFLSGFGLLGLILQCAFQRAFGVLLPGTLATLAVLPVSLYVVRISSIGLSKVIPKDETEAVSEDSFIGRVARITLGTAASGRPAQAKLRDKYGQTHYVMVEPDSADTSFPSGTEVLLVDRAGAVFRAIRNTSAALTDN